MKKINKNIGLLEYGGSHTECMHIQIKALREAGYNIYLICNKSLEDKFEDLSVFSDILLLNDVEAKLVFKQKLKDVLAVRKFTKKHRVNTLVINTLEHKIVRNLFWLPLPKVKNYVAIVHNGAYISNSGTFNSFYRNIKKVLVLSENIVKNIVSIPRPLYLKSFYPIYFPSYPANQLIKKEEEFWVVVPGAINEERKDIIPFLEAIEKTELVNKVKLVLLGVIDKKIYSRVKKLSEERNINIELFENRISQDVFDAYIQLSDVILPLINNDFYDGYRISGTYNLAYAYKKVMLVEKRIKESNADFDGITIGYDRGELIEVINRISTFPKEYTDCSEFLENHAYLTVAKQCENFIDAIEEGVDVVDVV